MENSRFVKSHKAGSIANGDIQLISRQLQRLGTYKFLVVDSVDRMTKPEYWDRVVAVFVTGQLWQFKQYFWSDPNVLFSKVAGFCLTPDNDQVPKVVREWNVDSIKIDSLQRFRDREVVEMIWNKIEKVMIAKGWQPKKVRR